MLPSNGVTIKQKRNYHMTLKELGMLLKYLQKNYDTKWWILVLTQASLGLRASEVLNIQLCDFQDNVWKLKYRKAKTNDVDIIPLPKPLRHILIAYITKNAHRMVDGYIWGKKYSTEVYGAFWSKWRKGLGNSFMDSYVFNDQKIRYRIGSHSLRRLHRTLMVKKHPTRLYEVMVACGYSDWGSFQRYINEYEMMTQRKNLLLEAINPAVAQVTMFKDGQTQIDNYI